MTDNISYRKCYFVERELILKKYCKSLSIMVKLESKREQIVEIGNFIFYFRDVIILHCEVRIRYNERNFMFCKQLFLILEILMTKLFRFTAVTK